MFAFILGYIGFILAVFFAFYVPGRVLLGKIEFAGLYKTVVAITVGVVLWAFQGLLFGYLHIRWFSYLYLLAFLGVFLWQKHYKEFTVRLKIKWDIPAVLLILVGIIGQVFPYIRTGWVTTQGVIIAAHNPDDHMWHAALVKELVKRFPPNEPSIAGVALKDYHYLYNLVTADLIRVFHLPFFITQFDGMYLLAPVLLGIIAYAVSQKIWKSKLFTWLFLFFLYFSGNAAGWVMLAMRHAFVWNLSSLINDASKFMDSPPYGYAIVIGLTGLYLLLQYGEKLPKRILVACALLFGCLLEFKVYVGIPWLVAFGAYAAGRLLKKDITACVSFLFAGALAYLLLKLGSSSSAGLFFLPVDIPRDFINQPLLQLTDWQLRWVIFQDHHNVIRLIQYGAMMSGFYLLVQFGLQLLGIIPFSWTIKKLGLSQSLFFFAGIVSAFLLGLFFYQTVGGANIWEFFLAAAPLLSLTTALTMSLVLEKKKFVIQTVIIGMVVIFVIPQWIISMQGYFHEEYQTGFHGISAPQAASFAYLQKVSQNSLIFLANQQTYSYASVANLFVQQDLYLSGNGVRQIVTPEIAKRRQEELTVTTSTDSTEISHILHAEHISYLYYFGTPTNKNALQKAHLKIVFANSAATIFQVQ